MGRPTRAARPAVGDPARPRRSRGPRVVATSAIPARRGRRRSDARRRRSDGHRPTARLPPARGRERPGRPHAPAVPIRLVDLYPLLAQAYRDNYVWLRDFEDDSCSSAATSSRSSGPSPTAGPRPEPAGWPLPGRVRGPYAWGSGRTARAAPGPGRRRPGPGRRPLSLARTRPSDAFTIERHGEVTVIVASPALETIDPTPGRQAPPSADARPAPRPATPLVVVDLARRRLLRLGLPLACCSAAGSSCDAKGGQMVLCRRLPRATRAAPHHLARHGLADLRRPPRGDRGPPGRLSRRPRTSAGTRLTVAGRPADDDGCRPAARTDPRRPPGPDSGRCPPEPPWASTTANIIATDSGGSGFFSGVPRPARRSILINVAVFLGRSGSISPDRLLPRLWLATSADIFRARPGLAADHLGVPARRRPVPHPLEHAVPLDRRPRGRGDLRQPRVPG